MQLLINFSKILLIVVPLNRVGLEVSYTQYYLNKRVLKVVYNIGASHKHIEI